MAQYQLTVANHFIAKSKKAKELCQPAQQLQNAYGREQNAKPGSLICQKGQ
jgi:hypothetical protein